MNRKYFQIIALLFLFLSTALSAAEVKVGKLSYLDGTITIIRNGKAIAANQIGINFQINNLDQVRVSKKSQAEISFDPSTKINAKLSLRADTIITINTAALNTGNKTGIDLIAGSLSMKVNKLANGVNLDIRSGTATMGVRGTTFDLTIAPSGDILLSTEEGKVSCVSDSGSEFFSTPDNVVVGTWDDRWTNENVPVTNLAKFRSEWLSKRIDTFKSAPLKAMRQFANRYTKFAKDFNGAWSELQSNIDILTRWVKEDQAGNLGSDKAQMQRDQKAMVGALNKLRAALFMLETARYRLQQISEIYPSAGLESKLDDGRSVRLFLQRFKSENSLLNKRIDTVYYYLKMFELRSAHIFSFDMGPDSESDIEVEMDMDLESEEDF